MSEELYGQSVGASGKSEGWRILLGYDHWLAGRLAASVRPNMVSFCRCGLGFFGEDVAEADQRLSDHVAAVNGNGKAGHRDG